MQSVVDAATGLLFTVLSFLLVPTIVLLLLRRFLPVLGDAMWRGYCQVLIWLVKAPIAVVRFLFRELTHRR